MNAVSFDLFPVPTGRRDPDELARGLYDAVKPQLYAYDRYADAYLRAPT